MIYLGYLCEAIMWGVSGWVLYWMVKEWRESSMPEERERKRLKILSMAIRKER
jgi:hypothetical protein